MGDHNTIENFLKNRILDQKVQFLCTFSLNSENRILNLKFEKVIKTNQNVPKTVGNHWEQLVFGLGEQF